MRASLQRSCNACARSKHACDLQTPRCSRCIKRKTSCVYANEPLTSRSLREASEVSGRRREEILGDGKRRRMSPECSVGLVNAPDASFDPFDSYPPTRLPRAHVQRLIHHFLSTIAFQYYPLDLSASSNPFIVSWWPLALADPALFHVSIQTASLDEELRAQKGFPVSEMLMVDSVALVRRKIGDAALAFQDETLNSVVTLAAIEHGKGNVEASTAHIDGVKRIVGVRGGIDAVRRTSPLTARMIAWVSMIVTGTPQFPIQDDFGYGTGVGPILQWAVASTSLNSRETTFDGIEIDAAVCDILMRLRNIMHQRLSGTELHDLTCFVVHKLLLLLPILPPNTRESAVSECLRYAMALYMLIIHGTTYYSHAFLAQNIVRRLRVHLGGLVETGYLAGSLGVWILSVGMVSTTGFPGHEWFVEQSRITASHLGLRNWDDVLPRLKGVLWMDGLEVQLFRAKWEEIYKASPTNS